MYVVMVKAIKISKHPSSVDHKSSPSWLSCHIFISQPRLEAGFDTRGSTWLSQVRKAHLLTKTQPFSSAQQLFLTSSV